MTARPPIAATLAALCACAVCRAQSAPTPPHPVRHDFDSSTGRDLRHYPPHRTADLLHERIELVIPDMNTPRATGVATIRFKAFMGEKASVSTLDLHAADLNIRAVSCDGHSARFSSNPGDDDLSITFDPPVAHDQTAEVRIEYEILDPPDGLTWTPESPLWPGRPASLHSQGEPESNRYWFPTHDFPNERLTSEVIVTVPDGYAAVSNGRLVSREQTTMPADPSHAAVRFHFAQEQEHAPYLVSLAVGKWDVTDVSTFGKRLPMPVYAPLGQGRRAAAVFRRTPAMISLYERLFSQPYPWSKYAQVVVTNFAWGGMENTSATTLYDTVVSDKVAELDGDQDDLICHELAHQWFGDLLTCRSWEHIWLNEGWATYAEALWAQYRQSDLPSSRAEQTDSPTIGLRADNDAYQYKVWSNFRDTIENDRGIAPFEPAMASKEYAFPDQVFDRDANPYSKGAAVLHMLRQKLTDNTFWRGVALYTSRHRDTAVETFDFRTSLEEVSGLSLQRFFDQWCFRPGVPRLRVTPTWNSEHRTLTLTVEQTQPIDGPNPAFAFDLPVWIDDGGRPVVATVHSETRTATLDIPLSSEPRRFVVDPDLQVLAEVQLRQPAPAFVETLRSGPTLAAKLRAATRLAVEPGDRGIEALADTARDARAYYGLRIEAAKALGRLANPSAAQDEDADRPPPADAAAQAHPEALAALVKLSQGDTEDARVRREIAAQLGIGGEHASRPEQEPAVRWLLSRWKDDESYAVRAECLRSLGRLKALDAMPILPQGLQTPSQDDAIRVGAIDGLRYSGFPDALDHILAMTAPDRSPPVRQAAIRAAGKLAPESPDRVFNLLSALIHDPELRTRQAAVETLLDLDDPRARPTIEQWTAGARSRSEREWGRYLLRKNAEESASPRAAAAP